MSGPTARRLMGQEERQAQILRAAATAFARGGFAATSMDDVASQAGITRIIIYRHFDSKEDLYRAVLVKITERLAEEFILGMTAVGPERRGFIVGSMLTVARENPDGFRLLAVHATREPQFASLHDEWRALAIKVADDLIGDTIPDAVDKAWATRTIVAYLVVSLLAWLEVGEAERDRDFVEMATDGLVAMFLAWTPCGRPVARGQKKTGQPSGQPPSMARLDRQPDLGN